MGVLEDVGDYRSLSLHPGLGSIVLSRNGIS